MAHSNKSIVGKQIRKRIGNTVVALGSTDEELFDYYKEQLKDNVSSEGIERSKLAKGQLKNDDVLIGILS